MSRYNVYINGRLNGTMEFTPAEMAHLKKSGYARKKGMTFKKLK